MESFHSFTIALTHPKGAQSSREKEQNSIEQQAYPDKTLPKQESDHLLHVMCWPMVLRGAQRRASGSEMLYNWLEQSLNCSNSTDYKKTLWLEKVWQYKRQ